MIDLDELTPHDALVAGLTKLRDEAPYPSKERNLAGALLDMLYALPDHNSLECVKNTGSALYIKRVGKLLVKEEKTLDPNSKQQ